MEKIKGFQKVLALLNSGPSQNNDDWAICYASSFFYEHSKIHVPSTCTKIISRHFFCKIHEFQIFLGKKLRFNYGQRIVIKTEWLGKNGTICGVLNSTNLVDDLFELFLKNETLSYIGLHNSILASTVLTATWTDIKIGLWNCFQNLFVWGKNACWQLLKDSWFTDYPWHSHKKK